MFCVTQFPFTWHPLFRDNLSIGYIPNHCISSFPGWDKYHMPRKAFPMSLEDGRDRGLLSKRDREMLIKNIWVTKWKWARFVYWLLSLQYVFDMDGNNKEISTVRRGNIHYFTYLDFLRNCSIRTWLKDDVWKWFRHAIPLWVLK